MLRVCGLLLPLLLVLFCRPPVAIAEDEEEFHEDDIRSLAKEMGSDEEQFQDPSAGEEPPVPLNPEHLEDEVLPAAGQLNPENLEEPKGPSPDEAPYVPAPQENELEPALLEDTNAECPNWALTGMCTENPEFMLKKCPVSCANAEVKPEVASASEDTCSVEDRAAGLCGAASSPEVVSSPEAIKEALDLQDTTETTTVEQSEEDLNELKRQAEEEAKRTFEELKRESEDEEDEEDEEAHNEELKRESEEGVRYGDAVEEPGALQRERAQAYKPSDQEEEAAALEAERARPALEAERSEDLYKRYASEKKETITTTEKPTTEKPWIADEDDTRKKPAYDDDLAQREPQVATQHIDPRDYDDARHSLEEAELEAEKLRGDIQVLKQQKIDAQMQEEAAMQKAQKAEQARAQMNREIEALRQQAEDAEQARQQDVEAAREEGRKEAKLEADKRLREAEDQMARVEAQYVQRQKADAGMKDGILAVNSVFSVLGAWAYTVVFGAFQNSMAQLASLEPPLNIIVGFFSVFVMFMVSVRGFGKRSMPMPVMAAPMRPVAMPAASSGNVDISAALAPLQQQIDGLWRHQSAESINVARNIQKLEAQLKHFQNECNSVEEEMLMSTKEILAWLAPGETPERPVAQAPTTTVNGISLQQNSSRTPTTEVASTNGVTASSHLEAPCSRAVPSAPVQTLTEATHEPATSSTSEGIKNADDSTVTKPLQEMPLAPSLPPQLDETITATQPVEAVKNADDSPVSNALRATPLADFMSMDKAAPAVPSSAPPTQQPGLSMVPTPAPVEEVPPVAETDLGPPAPINPPPSDLAPAVSAPPMFGVSPPAVTSSGSPPTLNGPPSVSEPPTAPPSAPLFTGGPPAGPPAVNGLSEPPTTPLSSPPPSIGGLGGPPSGGPPSGPPVGGSRPEPQKINAVSNPFGGNLSRPQQQPIKAVTSAFGARPQPKAIIPTMSAFGAPK